MLSIIVLHAAQLLDMTVSTLSLTYLIVVEQPQAVGSSVLHLILYDAESCHLHIFSFFPVLACSVSTLMTADITRMNNARITNMLDIMTSEHLTLAASAGWGNGDHELIHKELLRDKSQYRDRCNEKKKDLT